ncbi:hypothetical protein [Gemmata sp.]|uniref:hypothetical protein n=1 Tax=Gemmata sp. TaxID=1914242 RepID=UPI003F706840
MDADPQFIVRRLGWHQAPHGDHYTRRLPTASEILAFDTFDAAEGHRRQLEADARRGENPFRFGGAALYFQSSLDAPRLHDWLLDTGIDPPVEQLRHRDWREWWDAFSHTWSEEQLHHAWQGLDKVRYFDVAEEVDREPLRLVVEISFVERGNRDRTAVREGGMPHALFRRERDARVRCDRLNADRREAEQFEWWVYGYGQRLGYNSRARDPAETVFYEVLKVRGEIGSGEPSGFLVQRRAIDPSGFASHDARGRDTRARVPVRVFADRASAAAHCDELTARAHATMNPFQVFPPELAGLSEGHFVEAVAALGPPLPWPMSLRPALWREWWDLCQDEVTPEQRDAAWELFVAHPLFEVLPIPVAEA